MSFNFVLFACLFFIHFNRNLHIKQVTLFQNFPNIDIFHPFFVLLHLLLFTRLPTQLLSALALAFHCHSLPYIQNTLALYPPLYLSLCLSLCVSLFHIQIKPYCNPLNRPKPNRIQTNSALVSHFAFRFCFLSRYAVLFFVQPV